MKAMYNMANRFYKEKKSDRVWWKDNCGQKGAMEFSFDKKTVFNLFLDYPEKLTEEQKRIFDQENPYWADFFKGEPKAIKLENDYGEENTNNTD